jgi:hypothetical protein
MIQFSVGMTTDIVTNSTLAKIRRDVNREAGKYIATGPILKSKFTQSVKYDGGYTGRSPKYQRWKLRKVGHNIPNVLSGKLKQLLPQDAANRVKATQNGGNVTLRPYWSGAGSYKSNGKVRTSGFRESQRQEFEHLGSRQQQRLANHMRDSFLKQINDPKNARKRAIKRPKGA